MTRTKSCAYVGMRAHKTRVGEVQGMVQKHYGLAWIADALTPCAAQLE